MAAPAFTTRRVVALVGEPRLGQEWFERLAARSDFAYQETGYLLLGEDDQLTEPEQRIVESVLIDAANEHEKLLEAIDEDKRLMKSVGRLATYLQGYGELLIDTNGWDRAVLERFRADELVSNFRGGIDVHATVEQLEHIATLIPDEWLSYSATGSPKRCVEAIRHQRTLGCDGVILHGASPTELEPIVEAYRLDA